MPIVLRKKGFTFGFFASDANEPPHVHASKGRRSAKFWLSPVRLEKNNRLKRHELNEAAKIVEAHRDFLLEKWNDFFGG